MKVSWPKNGCAAILNARAENGSSEDGLRGQFLLFVAGIVTDHRRDVERVRQVVHDGVKHRLDAAVLERGATEDRVELGVDRHLADAGLELVDR